MPTNRTSLSPSETHPYPAPIIGGTHAKYTTRLIDRTQVADGTLAFAFERPAGFEFTAGQYLTLTLHDP